MKRFAILPLAALVFATACNDTTNIAAPDGGANFAVNLKGGKSAKPSFHDHGLSLQSLGAVSGLGNGDIFVGLSATAIPAAVCKNPGSTQHQAPGQNPAPVTVTGGQAIPAAEIKNGNVSFNVTTQALANNPRASTGECPNGSWTYEITDLAFTTAAITIEQPQGTGLIRLTVNCTFTPATANGAVAAGRVSCTQVR